MLHDSPANSFTFLKKGHLRRNHRKPFRCRNEIRRSSLHGQFRHVERGCSVVDTGTSVLLLYGLHRAKQPPDRDHPLGHGREIYFWSFVVAVMIFAVGLSAALLGLIIAFVGTYFSIQLDLPVLDGVASILNSVVLAATAAVLARETKGLLMGEAADQPIVECIMHIAEGMEGVTHANGVITVHLGPEHIVGRSVWSSQMICEHLISKSKSSNWNAACAICVQPSLVFSLNRKVQPATRTPSQRRFGRPNSQWTWDGLVDLLSEHRRREGLA